MMKELIPLFVLLIPFYWMWRVHVATNARIDLMKELDMFLNPEKNNSEMAMDIVYNAYEDSKKHFFIVELLFFVFIKLKKDRIEVSKSAFDAYEAIPRAEKKKMTELLVKILITNIKLSPLTYFFLSILLSISGLIVALVDRMSPTKLRRSLRGLREKVLYSIYAF